MITKGEFSSLFFSANGLGRRNLRLLILAIRSLEKKSAGDDGLAYGE